MIDPNKALASRSGNVKTTSNLVAFLYELMRDHVTPGDVETCTHNADGFGEPWDLTNGWLATYARDVARRLMFTDKERQLLGAVEVLLVTHRRKPEDLTDEQNQTYDETLALIRRLKDL